MGSNRLVASTESFLRRYLTSCADFNVASKSRVDNSYRGELAEQRSEHVSESEDIGAQGEVVTISLSGGLRC